MPPEARKILKKMKEDEQRKEPGFAEEAKKFIKEKLTPSTDDTPGTAAFGDPTDIIPIGRALKGARMGKKVLDAAQRVAPIVKAFKHRKGLEKAGAAFIKPAVAVSKHVSPESIEKLKKAGFFIKGGR